MREHLRIESDDWKFLNARSILKKYTKQRTEESDSRKGIAEEKRLWSRYLYLSGKCRSR